MASRSTADFLAFLETEADFQAKLHQNRVLPRGLDAVSALIGKYPWQILLISSGISAVLFEGIKILWFR